MKTPSAVLSSELPLHLLNINVFYKICCMYISLILGTASLNKRKGVYFDFLAPERYFLLWGNNTSLGLTVA